MSNQYNRILDNYHLSEFTNDIYESKKDWYRLESMHGLPDSPNDIDESKEDWYRLESMHGLPDSPNDREQIISYTIHKYDTKSIEIPEKFSNLYDYDKIVINNIVNDVQTKNIYKCNIIIENSIIYNSDSIVYLIAKSISCNNFNREPCNSCSNCYNFNDSYDNSYLPLYQFQYSYHIDDMRLRDFETTKFKPLSDQYKYTFVYIKDASNITGKRLEKLIYLMQHTDENVIFLLHSNRIKYLDQKLIDIAMVYDTRL